MGIHGLGRVQAASCEPIVTASPTARMTNPPSRNGHQRHLQRQRRFRPMLRRCAAATALGLSLVGAAAPGLAQQGTARPSAPSSRTLSFSYGPLIRSLRVSSLETFVETGQVENDLAFFLGLGAVDPEAQARLRKVMVERAPINPLLVSRVLNTGVGDALLENLGVGITLLRGGNGKFAIRAALVNAAFSENGASLLSVMQQLPANVQLHVEEVLRIERLARRAIAGTERLVAVLGSLSEREVAEQKAVDFATLADPRKPGPYKVSQQVWRLRDPGRDRDLRVLVFAPSSGAKAALPVVVFSHGLGSQPEDFSEGLSHLASYGYVVAAPRHPGSDNIWIQDLLRGRRRELFDLNEFAERPRDLSFVLDELERRNGRDFQGRLELKRVGAAGHSFGGYTALALGGASVDVDHLRSDCRIPYGAGNPSLLLQCQALNLPEAPRNLRDPRVAAVFALNPVNRSIFGPKGLAALSVPVAFGSGTYDPATPAALEQAESFTWLGSENKYWIVVEGQAHVNFTKIDPGIKEALDSIAELTLPDQGLISGYMKATALPFFEVFLRGSSTYRPHLQASYARFLSTDQPFKLYLLSASSSDGLADAITAFRREQR
jgi:predicted dienelactone hydrolase